MHSWILKKYKDSDQATARAGEYGRRSGRWISVRARLQEPEARRLTLTTFFTPSSVPTTASTVTFEFSDGKVFSRKTFQFVKDSYLVAGIDRGDRWRRSGSPPDRLARRIRRYDVCRAPSAAQHSIHYDAAAGKLGRPRRPRLPRTDRSPATGTSPSPGWKTAISPPYFFPAIGTTEIETFDDKAPTPFNSASRATRRRGRGRRRRQLASVVRRSQGPRHHEEGESEARAGGRLRLVLASSPSRCSWSCTG